jgi:hypothetical protein
LHVRVITNVARKRFASIAIVASELSNDAPQALKVLLNLSVVAAELTAVPNAYSHIDLCSLSKGAANIASFLVSIYRPKIVTYKCKSKRNGADAKRGDLSAFS